MEGILPARQKEILKILLQEDSSITVREISEVLNVSNKTIRNDLIQAENFLQEKFNIGIEKKPGVGIWLDTDRETKLILEKLIRNNHTYIEPWSPEERQVYIIKKLLQVSKPITMEDLAKDLYVSRATIAKDLVKVEKWLDNYDLKLRKKRGTGIQIIGTERNNRRAISGLLETLEENEKAQSILNSHTLEGGCKRSYADYRALKKLIPNMDFDKIEEIVRAVEAKLDYSFSDDAFVCLIVHIAISIERLKNKKDIEMNKEQLQILKKKKEYEIAQWIGKQVEREFNVRIPESEIGYISLHLLGVKILDDSRLWGDGNAEFLTSIDSSVVELANEIIELVGNILFVDLTQDEKLLSGLVLHLRPTINRLKYGLSIKNPILPEIKEKYPSIFGASWASSVLFEKHFGLKVTEEEIGYIAIHIGAALERLDYKVKAIIVCNSGIGTAQLIATRLKKEITGLEIVGITSVYELSKSKSEDFHIVISTVPLDYKVKPVIITSIFVTEEDIRNINKFILNQRNKNNLPRTGTENSIKLFNPDLIFTNIGGESKEEIIKKVGSLLLEKGYIHKGFIDSALEREKITSTAIGKGVAIPHGRQEFVKRAFVALVKLDKAINWSRDEEVDLVFVLAPKFSEGSIMKNFFKSFYSMLDDENILAEIRRKNSSQDIYQILKKGENIYD